MDPRLVCLGLGSVCGKRGGRSHGCKQMHRYADPKSTHTPSPNRCTHVARNQQVVGIAVLCIGAAIIDVRAVLSMFMPASASRKQKSAAGSPPPSPASVSGAPSYQGVTAAPAPKWGWFRFANWYACVCVIVQPQGCCCSPSVSLLLCCLQGLLLYLFDHLRSPPQPAPRG